MEPLVNYFKDIEIHNILDVGTGTGAFLHVLKTTFPNSKITAVDPSKEELEIARQNFSDVDFVEMEAEKLDFADNTFDVVSISMALHHLPKVKKGLKEMKRVLKPEGYMIISEVISDNLNEAQEVHKLYHHFRSQTDRLLGRFHRKTFTKNAILQMLKTAELPVQFFFEQRSNVNLAADENNLNQKVKKMESMLEKIKDRPEYETLFPQVEEFREKAQKYGFQPATKLVIVIRKKIVA
jgi:ubiquinone/menaquinone biosynthesis C-methylase UbiE